MKQDNGFKQTYSDMNRKKSLLSRQRKERGKEEIEREKSAMPVCRVHKMSQTFLWMPISLAKHSSFHQARIPEITNSSRCF